MPIIAATQEAEIRRIMFGGQPRQKDTETTSKPVTRARWYMLVVLLHGSHRYRQED
jgi:hypothetical protein